jgi:hypothetical protein
MLSWRKTAPSRRHVELSEFRKLAGSHIVRSSVSVPHPTASLVPEAPSIPAVRACSMFPTGRTAVICPAPPSEWTRESRWNPPKSGADRPVVSAVLLRER